MLFAKDKEEQHPGADPANLFEVVRMRDLAAFRQLIDQGFRGLMSFGKVFAVDQDAVDD